MSTEKPTPSPDSRPGIVWSDNASGKSTAIYAKVFADYLLNKATPWYYADIFSLLSKSSREKKTKSLEQEKHALVKQLLESDIDPAAFDVLLSNEINRRLKVRFGIAFLVLTSLFTASSYAIVVLDGIYKWNISEAAITGLIIETPIQFAGLLYIIARNLFPSTAGDNNTPSTKIRLKKQDGQSED